LGKVEGREGKVKVPPKTNTVDLKKINTQRDPN
jgi:hypothetical protein